MNSGLDEKQASELDRERAKWIDESFPVEVQRKKADKTGNIFLKNSAESQYKEMGMRSVVWEFHENQVGQKLFQVLSLPKFLAKIYLTNFSSHDFNDSIGKIKVQSFVEKFPEAVSDFKQAWVEYMQYCYQVESGEVGSGEVEPVASRNRPTALCELDRDPKGYPLVPEEVGNLANMKNIVRSFVTIHYRRFMLFSFCRANFLETGFASGRKNDRVPWKQIKDHTDTFIEQRYLPDQAMDGIAQIEDPSDMKKEQITQLLDHWGRPVSGSELFRFSHVLVNSKTDEITRALYKNSFADVSICDPIDRQP